MILPPPCLMHDLLSCSVLHQMQQVTQRPESLVGPRNIFPKVVNVFAFYLYILI